MSNTFYTKLNELTLTLYPAKAINLDSQIGSLEVGKKADFITVHHDSVVPRIMEVYQQGDRVA